MGTDDQTLICMAVHVHVDYMHTYMSYIITKKQLSDPSYLPIQSPYTLSLSFSPQHQNSNMQRSTKINIFTYAQHLVNFSPNFTTRFLCASECIINAACNKTHYKKKDLSRCIVCSALCMCTPIFTSTHQCKFDNDVNDVTPL